ncbi:hypothetical protein [Cupriavidus metallidurans]
MRTDNDLLHAARNQKWTALDYLAAAICIGMLGTLIAMSALGNPI